LRPPKKHNNNSHHIQNGTLRPNQVFFNSLRDADRQLNDGARKTKDRLKETAPLQVMRFKDLLTAGGEHYNRQSNSDSSGERRVHTDSSSGDLESSENRHFRNISSGEETLLRGEHDVIRPVPVLPLQSYYNPRGSDPLLLPNYTPLGSDATPTSETHIGPVYTSESGGTPADGELSPGNDQWVRDSAVYADLAKAAALASERARSLRNGRTTEVTALKYPDVGHEIDV